MRFTNSAIHKLKKSVKHFSRLSCQALLWRILGKKFRTVSFVTLRENSIEQLLITNTNLCSNYTHYQINSSLFALLYCRISLKVLKGVFPWDFLPLFFHNFEPICMGDKQAKTFSNSGLISPRTFWLRWLNNTPESMFEA